MLRAVLALLAASGASALSLPPLRLPRAQRCQPHMAASDEDRAGVGFGRRNYDEEEARGREALEKLRTASKEKGYDSSLQGLQSTQEEPVEVPKEFKSQVILGLAGFLITGGVISLIVGGSIWEPTDKAPAEDTPAFGFVPKAASRPDMLPPPEVAQATW